jgi:hypothetical protein
MANTSTILIVTGAITAGTGVGAFAPAAVLRFLFGATAPDGLTVMITRHWALLVALIGGLLIYAAYHPEMRLAVMVAAIAEKLAIGLLIFTGPWRRSFWAVVVAGTDTAIALLYISIVWAGGSP